MHQTWKMTSFVVFALAISILSSNAQAVITGSCTDIAFTAEELRDRDNRLNEEAITVPEGTVNRILNTLPGNHVEDGSGNKGTCPKSRETGDGLVLHSKYNARTGKGASVGQIVDYDALDGDARVADNDCTNTDDNDGSDCAYLSENYTRDNGVRGIRWHGFKRRAGAFKCYSRSNGKLRRRFIGALSCFRDKADDYLACLMTGNSDCGRAIFDPSYYNNGTFEHAVAFCNACKHVTENQGSNRWCKGKHGFKFLEKHLFRAYTTDIINGVRTVVNTCEGTDTGSCGCNLSTGTCSGAVVVPTPPVGETEPAPTSSQSGFLFRTASE